MALTALCLLSVLVFAGANNDHNVHSLSVSASHLNYYCPEGANVTLVCAQYGGKVHAADRMGHAWLYTPHMDQPCHDRTHPRSHKGNHSNRTLGVLYGDKTDSFSVTLLDVTKADQGRYCCISLDLLLGTNHKASLQQRAHSHVLLTISPRRNDSMKCTEWDPKASQGSVAAGLATAACIMGILCLPLILVLVYRQRQGMHTSRRAHELVRMDSEAQGHENPVFMGCSPLPKTRIVSQILARQTSETGRHLLSDPGTPISVNANEVFFPAQEPIPEAPDFLQV